MRSPTLLVRSAALGAVAVLLSAAVLVFWPEIAQPTRATEENFVCLQGSMHRGSPLELRYEGTRSEVEAFLGAPGDYRTRPGTFRPPRCYVGHYPPGLPKTTLIWQTDDIAIHVVVDSAGNVLAMDSSTFKYISTASEWERFCWDLKRRWHRWFP
jgi:hypothetical protein